VTFPQTYLWRVRSNGQKTHERLDIAGPRVSGPSIASGGRLLYSRFVQDPDLWRYREGAPPETLVVSTASETNPQFSPDGSRIAFESNRSGAEEIWLADADGSRPVQLTNRMGRHQGTPRWSPDSRWVAFDSQGADGRWDIYVIDASGGQPRRLTSHPAPDYIPSWSRDGKWIYFCSLRTGRSEIWRIPSAGGAEERVTTDGGWVAFESLDGTTLHYNKSGTPSSFRNPLFARPVAGGPERQLLPDATRSFQPTREGVFFVTRPTAGPATQLLFLDFATGNVRTISAIDGRVLEGLAVAPDGRTVVVPVSRTWGADLMMIENLR